ncbi:DUF4374 domain-containing protein [Pedobacter nototheniae]|uniref:DUF4374 domain-containing protein n=1 Tax=Pedobacter nototheniae TaxID=2488994 RepID=UPI00103C20F9|nr:DUF4374 domain-containing protein [Pedobacter nototheniae]
MLKTNSKRFVLSALVMLVAGFSACKKSSTDPETTPPVGSTDYSLLVSAGSPAGTYILHTSSLTEGSVTTAGNGVETTDLTVITTKGGYYYATNAAGNLVKFSSDNKKNTIVKEIPFNKITWAYWSSFYLWKDDNTLIFFSVNSGLQYEYATLNVSTMTFTASGNINIPVPNAGYYYWGNSATFVGNKLYISYTKNANADDISVNESYLAAIDYPAMNNITVSTDTRFNYPSHYTLHAPGAFTDNSVAYFLNSPTIWATKMTNKPFGIYRVKTGATAVDNTYFYELTDRTKEEALGLYHVGTGKAIVKILDKTQIDGSSAYSTKYITDYYVVDVVNQTKTKLDIPKSISGGYSENVLVDGGVAYIAAKTNDGFYIYQYNVATGTVKRGLKLEGVTALSRLEKIK